MEDSMPDINKFIMNPSSASPEVIDRKLDMPEWSREIAQKTAAAEGITMTDPHWKVVAVLRQHFLEHGPASSGRELAKALDVAFDDQGGSRYLYQLFPDGPVAQGSRIAGLPLPPYTEDDSFGSVM